jgi:hypothetical protein
MTYMYVKSYTYVHTTHTIQDALCSPPSEKSRPPVPVEATPCAGAASTSRPPAAPVTPPAPVCNDRLDILRAWGLEGSPALSSGCSPGMSSTMDVEVVSSQELAAPVTRAQPLRATSAGSSRVHEDCTYTYIYVSYVYALFCLCELEC